MTGSLRAAGTRYPLTSSLCLQKLTWRSNPSDINVCRMKGKQEVSGPRFGPGPCESALALPMPRPNQARPRPLHQPWSRPNPPSQPWPRPTTSPGHIPKQPWPRPRPHSIGPSPAPNLATISHNHTPNSSGYAHTSAPVSPTTTPILVPTSSGHAHTPPNRSYPTQSIRSLSRPLPYQSCPPHPAPGPPQ